MSSTNDYPIFSDALVDEKVREVLRKEEVERDADTLSGDEHTAYILGMTLEEAQVKGYVKMKPVNASPRITWDQYGMQLANTAALRGDCLRRQVGAILMAADHSIISLGYNGGPSKGASCLAGQCPRGRSSKEEAPGNSAYDVGVGTCVALHAEWNVLIRTSWHQFEGSTLYVSHTPCHICKVMIAGTKIARVVAPSFEWTL